MNIYISKLSVCGDIMVLASPPHPPAPVDPDDVNAPKIFDRKIFDRSLSNFM